MTRDINYTKHTLNYGDIKSVKATFNQGDKIMTIEQVKQERDSLKIALIEAVTRFNVRTGMSVTDISLLNQHSVDGNNTPHIEISINLP